MDYRLCVLGLLGSLGGGLFCCENCYSAFLGLCGDSRKVSSYPRLTRVLQQLLVHRVEMPSTRLYMIFLVGSQTNPRLSRRPPIKVQREHLCVSLSAVDLDKSEVGVGASKELYGGGEPNASPGLRLFLKPPCLRYAVFLSNIIDLVLC